MADTEKITTTATPEAPASPEKTSLFQKLFGVGVDGSASRNHKKIYPAEVGKNKETGKYEFKATALSPKVEELLDYWMSQTHDSAASFENRFELYKDMDMLFYNAPLVWRAMTLTRDEVLQADSNIQIIGVEAADKRQRDFALKCIADNNIEAQLPATALNVIQFGDAGWILSLGEKGVKEVLPVDVYDIKDRLEFTPYEVKRQMEDKTSSSIVYNMRDQFDRIEMLVDSMTNDDNYTSYFKSYLFGFQIGEYVLPPWRFIHFRNFTSKSPFKPFGIPMYIHSVAPYRQWDAALTLRVAARGASFPIDLYKITLPNHMNPTEKLDSIIEFLNEYENTGLRQTKKEGMGLGERIVTIAGVFEYEQITPSIELGDSVDLEQLENQLILSTGLPRNFLDPNNGGFGSSGVALKEQHKPFARMVYQVQSILMQGITQVIKIAMIQSGEFEASEINFRLTMPYPESQTDRDLIGSQNDMLALAGTVLDTLKARILGEDFMDPLPPELVRQVFTQILPYDSDRINQWVDTLLAQKAAMPAPEEEGGEDMFESSRKRIKEITVSKNGKRGLAESIHTSIQDTFQKEFKEGVLGGRHHYSSTLPNMDFQTSLLEDFQKKLVTKLEEKERKSNKKEKSRLEESNNGYMEYYNEEYKVEIPEEESEDEDAEISHDEAILDDDAINEIQESNL